MSGRMSKSQERKEKALISGNVNRILWHQNRAAAYALFQHSLNVITANKIPDKDLLKLEGIGPGTIKAVRWAIESAFQQTAAD